jgi:hypothetical protein
MKLLSFIALFFYLSSLLPSAQFSAAEQWLTSPQNSPTHSLAQLTSSASPVKHLVLSDDDDHSLVQLHVQAATPGVSQTYSYVETAFYLQSPLPFLARGPPLALS